MEKNNNLYWLIGVLLMIIAFLLAMGLQTPPVIERTDTITLTKVIRNSFKVDSFIPIYIDKTKTIRDTLFQKDSIPVEVEIPIQMAYYDTTLIKEADTLHIKQTVEGYKPRLVNMEATVNRREKQTIINHTVTQTKKPLITYGIQAGFGYGFLNRKADAFVGFGVSLNL